MQRSPADIQRIYLWLGDSMIDGQADQGADVARGRRHGLEGNIEIADEANEPGKFTAFCSYEWTSMPDNRNMHRNVFFKDCAKVPDRCRSARSTRQAPEDLWNWMDGQRKAGNELLAISHNANLSDGLMFPTEVDFKGRPIDAAWAASRDRNERLTEIKQIKGASETHPLLSPNDEFASFEILNYLLGDPPGRIPTHPRQLRPAGAEGRPRDAGRARATTPTSSASSAARTRTTPACPTARTTSSAATRCNDGDDQGAHGRPRLRRPRRRASRTRPA